MEPTEAQLVEMFRRMVRIREFDERAGLLLERAIVPGAVHLYVGEEAVAVGVCAQLNDDDYITSTHRGHGHLIAKGGDLGKMFAEIYGKATGYCHGKGGSMHMADQSLGILGANGIVGAGGPIAAGAGYTCKFRKQGQVTVCFFGDGAAAEGSMHEAGNLAAVLNLPVIFVCENNLYGEFARVDEHHAISDIADMATGWGMAGAVVDGMDVLAVFEAAGEAIARARRGEGPTLLECKTYRFYDHLGRDYGLTKRPEDEIAHWKARDPIARLGAALAERGLISAADQDRIVEETRAEIEAAIAFAQESPEPAPSALLEDVYVPEPAGTTNS